MIEDFETYHERDGSADVVSEVARLGPAALEAFDSVLRFLLLEDENEWENWTEEFKRLENRGDSCGGLYEIRFAAPPLTDPGGMPTQFRALGAFGFRPPDFSDHVFWILLVFRKPPLSGLTSRRLVIRRVRKSSNLYEPHCRKAKTRLNKLEKNEAITKIYEP